MDLSTLPDSVYLIVGAFLSGIVGIVTTVITSYLKRRERKKIIASAFYSEIEAMEDIIAQFHRSLEERGDDHDLTLDDIIQKINKNFNRIPLDAYNPLYPSDGWYHLYKNETIIFGFPLFQKIDTFYKSIVYLSTLIIEYYNIDTNCSNGTTSGVTKTIKTLQVNSKRGNISTNTKITVSLINDLIPDLKNELKIYTKSFFLWVWLRKLHPLKKREISDLPKHDN